MLQRKKSNILYYFSPYNHANLLISKKNKNNISGKIYGPSYVQIPPLPFTGSINNDIITIDVLNENLQFHNPGDSDAFPNISTSWHLKNHTSMQLILLKNEQFSDSAIWFNQGGCLEYPAGLMARLAVPKNQHKKVKIELNRLSNEGIGFQGAPDPDQFVSFYKALINKSKIRLYYDSLGYVIIPENLTEFEVAKKLRKTGLFDFVDLTPIGDCGGADLSFLLFPKSKFYNDKSFDSQKWQSAIDKALIGSLQYDKLSPILKNRNANSFHKGTIHTYSMRIIAPSESTRKFKGQWDTFRLTFQTFSGTYESKSQFSVEMYVTNFLTIPRSKLSNSIPSDIHFKSNNNNNSFDTYFGEEYDVLKNIHTFISKRIPAKCLLSEIGRPDLVCR